MKKLLIRVTELILSSIVVIGLVACGSNTADEVSDKDELTNVNIEINEDDNDEKYVDNSTDDTSKNETDTSIDEAETADSFTESEEVATETGWAVLEAYLIENGEHYSGDINPVRKGETYSLSLPMKNADELYLYLCIPDEGDKWINITFIGDRREQRHYAEYYASKNAFHDNCVPNKTCPIDPATITRNTIYSDFEVYDEESGDWVQLIDEADIKEENEIIISLFTYYDSFVRGELGLTMSDFGFYEWDCE